MDQLYYYFVDEEELRLFLASHGIYYDKLPNEDEDDGEERTHQV